MSSVGLSHVRMWTELGAEGIALFAAEFEQCLSWLCYGICVLLSVSERQTDVQTDRKTDRRTDRQDELYSAM